MKKVIYVVLFFFPVLLNVQIYSQPEKTDEGEDIELLKLAEAEAQRIDTTEQFHLEMARFRSELLRSISGGERDPEFIRLMEEYKRGLLLFELTNKEVYLRSYTDTVGLRRFYEKHRPAYQWTEPHFRGFVVHNKTKSERERLQQEINGLPLDSAANYLRQTYIREDTALIKLGGIKVFAKGDDEYVDELIFHTGRGVPYLEFPRYFVVGKLLEQPQVYTDVAAEVMDDYQKYLEERWIEQLRKRSGNKLIMGKQ
jgi:hypothetical protein